jgi:enoyl-[acyl-carrier protein] reductase II
MEDVSELLGTRYPIIMGALGAVASPELVAAVSEAGGFGLIATVSLDAEGLRDMIHAIRDMTDKPFGANLMALNPNSPQMAEVLAEEGIGAVTTSAGSPKALTSLLREAGIKVLHVVPTPPLAAKAEGAGVNGVIAEGGESGGMQSQHAISAFCLTPQVVDAVAVPVVAAGGIFDARGYAAAFMLGAKGVQLGTRLILTEESAASREYKMALLEAGPEDTCVLPMQVGPLRALSNAFVEGLQGLPEDEKQQTVTEAWARFNQTVLQDSAKSSLVMTGSCAGAIHEIMPAGEVIRSIGEEGQALLGSHS